MSYKTELQLNNAELEQILESILALPDAGSTDPVVEKDVNFYDYDGELLYSYTLAEAQVLSELPPAPAPKKDFIVFDEWNWTLEQIKSLNLPIDVGATYKTVYDKTYLVIEVTEPERKEITLNYCQWCSSIKVNWGDGSAEEETTTSGGTNVTKKHTYSSLGKYTITITVSGTWNAGLNNATGPLVGMGNNDYLSGAFLREVYAGKGMRLLSYAFLRANQLETVMLSRQVSIAETWGSVFIHCYRLKAAIFPSNVTVINGYYLDYCYSVSVLSLPYNMTKASGFNGTRIKRFTASPKLKTFALSACRYLEKVWISEGVESLGGSCFDNCSMLTSLELPESLKSISYTAFCYCTSLMRIRFKSNIPPTVSNSNAFTELPKTCIVEVPTASLDAYKAATNYGTIAAQMVGV